MTLVKYNPRDYRPATFSNFIDKFFNEDFYGNKEAASFSPKVDIAETEKEFEVQFHIPGMKKEDIKIDLEKDRLTVSGERKLKQEKTEKNFHSVESYYGTFHRSFFLPDTVNVEKIDASYQDGILTVILPKDAKKEAKKTIAIK
ncbi:MAG: Hsp20/alpha crystallin family protein [Cyclobacteriaceae bacterium]